MRAEFDNTLITGDEMIDSQHQELIGKINTLLESCEEGNDKLTAVKTLDYLAEYTDFHFSAEEKLLKPSHEIYERLCEKFELKMEECWFIDDSVMNVEGAIYAGMKGCVFYGDVPRLRQELRRAGIRCRE